MGAVFGQEVLKQDAAETDITEAASYRGRQESIGNCQVKLREQYEYRVVNLCRRNAPYQATQERSATASYNERIVRHITLL